jgi:cbb3-type cytochrome oxidase subunit 3
MTFEWLDSVLISWIIVMLGVVVAVGAYLLWLRRRRTRTEELRTIPLDGTVRAMPQPGEVERRIAVELEAEILRRIALVQGGGA